MSLVSLESMRKSASLREMSLSPSLADDSSEKW